MTGNARQWAIEIDQQWAEAMGGLHRAVAYVATEALARVQRKSPVDTGQFRANWLISIGAPDPSTEQGPSPAFAAKSSAALASYAAQEGFPVVYLQNNLPYANRLENGWSKQAPDGMVGLTVAELSALWNGTKV